MAKLVKADIRYENDRIAVYPIFSGVDRTESGGYSMGKISKANEKLAVRFVAAMMAGKLLNDMSVKTDVDNKTYVSTAINISMRRANSELARLGF